MTKLFVVGIGGRIHNANIEVHDVEWVIADAIENTYDILKRDWYGESLHVDEYKVLIGADGHSIQIGDEPQKSNQNLFFVNMGGYLKEIFGEQHEHGFFVAETEEEARKKAEKVLLKNIHDKHIDNIFKVVDRLKFADGKKVYIHLTEDGNVYPFTPDWSGYHKLV